MDRKFFFNDSLGKPISPLTPDYEIPENMKFMSACNPYNIVIKKGSQETQDNDLECKFEEEENRNKRQTHKVNPLKSSLLSIVWDFGALSEKDEMEYIKRMLKGKTPKMEVLKEVVFICQCFIKIDLEKNKSSVSLRDIDRVNKIFHFSYALLNFFEGNGSLTLDQHLDQYQKSFMESEIDDNRFFDAMSITIAVNYYFRLHKNGRCHFLVLCLFHVITFY